VEVPAPVEFGIVNYNGGTALGECVASILDQRGGGCGVWVFDNGSSDGSVEAVEAAFPEVRVIRSERNLGYAGALNRLLGAMESEIVVLCNMDLRFDPGWAQAVRETLAREPDADAVATLVVEDTDPPRVNSLGVRFYGDLHAQNVGSGDVYRPEVVERGLDRAFGSYGAVMCFRRRAVEDLEFDASYFLFFEETDFFLRFDLVGRRTVFARGAVVRHHRSLSTQRYSPLKLYYGERNRLTTVFKLLPVWYWPVSFGYTILRLIILARGPEGRGGAGMASAGPVRLPSRGRIVWTLVRAWTAALARLPGTLRKRRAFWRGARTKPGDALDLMRRYRLATGELRLR
jgi:GT2 family glycosyltransferase